MGIAPEHLPRRRCGTRTRSPLLQRSDIRPRFLSRPSYQSCSSTGQCPIPCRSNVWRTASEQSMAGRPLQASDRAVLAGLARLLPRQAPKGRPPGPPHPRVPDSRLTWMEEVLGNHRQSRQPSLYAGVDPETGAGRKTRARLPIQAGPGSPVAGVGVDRTRSGRGPPIRIGTAGGWLWPGRA